MQFTEYLTTSVNAIGYTGASVTVQQSGYRDSIHKKIENFLQKDLKQVVNGVGGVGSLFCLMNEEQVVGDQKRDVIFYECFTGDVNRGITPKDLLQPLLSEYCRRHGGVPLVFVLNYRHDKTLEEMTLVGQEYRNVANQTGAIVVDVFSEIHALLSEGVYKVEELFRDGVHPTAIGAEKIADIIWSLLSESAAIPVQSAYEASNFQIKDRVFNLSGLRYINAKDLAKILSVETEIFDYKNTGQQFEYCSYSSLNSKLTKSGLVVGFLGLIGPRSPLFVEFNVDQRMFKLRTFDRNCFYIRPQTFSTVAIEGDGVCSFKPLDEQPDFSICSRTSPDFDLERLSSICGIYVVDAGV